MGVSFYTCGRCSGTVCDAGDIFRCEHCSGKFHESCAGPRFVDVEYFQYDEDDIRRYDSRDATNEERCPVCSLKIITNEDLLNFVLNKYKLSRKKAEKLFRESKK